MGDRITVSTVAHRLKGTSCSDGGRPPAAAQNWLHPFGYSLFSHSAVETLGASIHYGDWDAGK